MKFELEIDRRNVTDEMLLSDITTLVQKLGVRVPTIAQYNKFGTFHATTLIRRFGSWSIALSKAGIEPVHHNSGIEATKALDDLREVVKRLGRDTISKKEYDKEGKFSGQTLAKRYGTWNKALEAAGFSIKHRLDISDDELFENIERLWRHFGRQPKYGEVQKPDSAFSAGTYENRFGGWRKALEAFVVYIQQQPSEEIETETVTSNELIVINDVPKRDGTRTVNWRLRFLVMQRDGFRCFYCGASPAKGDVVNLHVDHIIPWSKGGKTVIENLRTSCEPCNIGKSNLDLDVAEA